MLDLVVMRVLLYCALAGGVWLYGFSVGTSHQKAKYEAAQVVAVQKQIAATNQLVDSFNSAKTKYDEAVKTYSDTVASLLTSVRNRQARIVVSKTPASEPICAGNTGLELSKPDAEFLIGQAAESMKWQNKLIECYSQIDGLTKAMESTSSIK